MTLHDELPEGLTLDPDSFVISVGSSLASVSGQVSDTYYTITTTSLSDDCTFEITFTDEFTSSILTSSQRIIVQYSAVVNSDAVIYSTGNINTAYVSYGNNSYSTEVTTATYVYELYVYKYTETEVLGVTTEVALEGAEFVLYRTVSGTNYYVVLDSDGLLESETTDINSATHLTDSTGLVYFGGLDAGTYYLLETEAPTGYVPPSEPVTVEIAQNGTVANVGTVTGLANGAIKIYNGSSSEMPTTGGIGTTIFYVVGGVLVIGAIILLITKKRMKSDDKE